MKEKLRFRDIFKKGHFWIWVALFYIYTTAINGIGEGTVYNIFAAIVWTFIIYCIIYAIQNSRSERNQTKKNIKH